MDFIVGLPNISQKNDSIWVIVDRFTKTDHFIPVHTTYIGKKYPEIYLECIICLHGVPKMIIFIVVLNSSTLLGTIARISSYKIDSKFSLSSSNRWANRKSEPNSIRYAWSMRHSL